MSHKTVLNSIKCRRHSFVHQVVTIILLFVTASALFFPDNTYGAESVTSPSKNKKDASLEFNSAHQDSISISDSEQVGLDITGDMTISLWMRPTTLSGEMDLVSKWNHVSKTSYLLYIENGNIGIRLNSADSGFGYKTYETPIGKSPNEWIQIAMVYTAASGTAEFFANGISIGKSPDFALPTSISDTEASFIVGSRENQDTFFDGKIDDLRIWSRALTSNDAVLLFKHPKKFNNGAQLQGFWKFNRNLNDVSGNGNDLGITFSNDVPY